MLAVSKIPFGNFGQPLRGFLVPLVFLDNLWVLTQALCLGRAFGPAAFLCRATWHFLSVTILFLGFNPLQNPLGCPKNLWFFGSYPKLCIQNPKGVLERVKPSDPKTQRVFGKGNRSKTPKGFWSYPSLTCRRQVRRQGPKLFEKNPCCLSLVFLNNPKGSTQAKGLGRPKAVPKALWAFGKPKPSDPKLFFQNPFGVLESSKTPLGFWRVPKNYSFTQSSALGYRLKKNQRFFF